MTTADTVRNALRNVIDPCSAATGSDLDIVEMGLIRSVEVQDEHVRVAMRVTTPACQMIAYFHSEIENQVESLSGVTSVELEVDDGLEWDKGMMSDDAKRRRQEQLQKRRQAYEAEIETHHGDHVDQADP